MVMAEPPARLGPAGPAPPERLALADRDDWARRLVGSARQGAPLLAHLNGDTTWLLQLPRRETTAEGRTHVNLLLDPWLRGPQSDVAAWFSTQWHLVAPAFECVADLDAALRDVEARAAAQLAAGPGPELGPGPEPEPEPGPRPRPKPESGTPPRPPPPPSQQQQHIDAVIVSHEFTDHCHRATLLELAPHTPVVAPAVAADLIRSWGHFDAVATAPALRAADDWSPAALPAVAGLPSGVAVARLVAPDNSLYYHSAMVVAFGLDGRDALVYAPHGVRSRDLDGITASGLRPRALLHGLHDVRIWMAKQLNLGALNAIEAVAATGARYWVATHDEDKKAGGLLAPFLRRTRYSVKDAVQHQQRLLREQHGPQAVPDHHFYELGSGQGICLD